jgi:hypothetical protein
MANLTSRRSQLRELRGPDTEGSLGGIGLLPLEDPRVEVYVGDGEIRRFTVSGATDGVSEDEDVSSDEDSDDGDQVHIPDLVDPLPDELLLYRGLKTLYHFSDLLLTNTSLTEDTPRLTKGHLLACLDEVYIKYVRLLPKDSNPNMVYDLLGFNTANFINNRQLEERRLRLDTLVLGLLTHCLKRCIIVPKTVGGTLMEGRINRVRENIAVLCQSLQVHQRLIQGSNVNAAAQAGALVDVVDPSTFSEAKNAELVTLHMLRYAQVSNYAKMSDQVYQQQTVTGRDRRGQLKMYFTRAWSPVCSMTEFIYLNVKKEQSPEVWSAMVGGANMVKRVADYLTNCYESELPRLNLHRRVFAFQNGLYFADNLCFKRYDDIAAGKEHVDSSIVACKLFDQTFVDVFSLPPQVSNIVYWWDIPTPAFESILRDQHLGCDYDLGIRRGELGYSLDEEQKVHRWIYALLGRLMYRVGERDNWQTILFIHGKANTGKSTIANMIQKLYLKQNIGVLSNNIETKFGLSALLDKFFYICYELKNDFSLDQSEFQSMVSGEDMCIAVKGQTAKTLKWDQPGLFLGNTYAGTWLDNSGSIARRLVIVDFFQEIVASNPQLDQELEREMPAMIQKMNMGYLYMVAKYGKRGIWDKASGRGEQVLPDYFHLTQKRMLTSTHPLRLFIHTLMSDFFVLDPNGYVPLNDFYRRFKEKTPGFERQRIVWNPEYYRAPFSAYGLTVTLAETRTWDGEERHESWLQGIDLVKHQ